MNTYPIKFIPILKERIWGGEKLIKNFRKKSNQTNIGESWEISDVDGDVSIVANGRYKGNSIKQLISEYKGEFVGNNVYSQFGNAFPILIKFLDAKSPLSIQVHPDNELAKKRHNSFGKNEMWYVMDVEPDSELIVGFDKKVSPSEYVKSLENNTILDILNTEKVTIGDTFYIPTGRIHAIGAGTVIAEIQQTSDITYRIYDYERVDINSGKQRELHTDLALDAIDYTVYNNYKTNYKSIPNKSSKLIYTPYFKTNIIQLNQQIEKDYSTLDSFVIYMCVDGSFEIKMNDEICNMQKGETVLLPATTKTLFLNAKKATILEVYL